MPTADELAAAKPGDLPALLDPTLSSGSIEVTIVGDVTLEQAISEVGRTLAALPPRAEPRAVPGASPTLRPPEGGGPPTVLRHKGRPDQAFAYVEWPTTDFYADPHQAHVLVLAAGVLQNRLIDRIRVTEGATYAPNADSAAYSEMIGYGYVQASVEIPPPRIDGFFRDINEILADLGRAPPSADEVLRARAPLLETEAKSRETMDFWSYYLSHAQTDPREIGAIRRKVADFNSISAEEISAACRKYLTPDRAWRLIVKAAD
jgi:zinc protease